MARVRDQQVLDAASNDFEFGLEVLAVFLKSNIP